MEQLQSCKDFGCDCKECESVGICLLFQGLPDIHIEWQYENNDEKGVNE